ncbi:hypothetical protein PAXRUDRAFT_180066 [Paxillus rubicundulus Ve08.2h10]|uniref:DDE Tnp4 domain-containing protein n=1 Tax=Paxillus rubicundulus Ve08.2h10 TaxID=930991 RepID=A0A0D0CYZ2_9AGAM|nr:hypothetical protein PAXRUDRAFT_180066 [Paxillus rubicundulus Ve08.2h10]
MQFPDLDSEDAERAQAYSQAHSCPGWHKGILVADGSAFCLYAKPSMHGETFFDCKSNYSLNCQASICHVLVFPLHWNIDLFSILHNLLIADYGLGLPGSVHDAYAFQHTRTSREHAELLGDQHWIWADSAYPSEPWCVVPFKKPWGGWLTHDKNNFNQYLSTVNYSLTNVVYCLIFLNRSMCMLSMPLVP